MSDSSDEIERIPSFIGVNTLFILLAVELKVNDTKLLHTMYYKLQKKIEHNERKKKELYMI